ncbi:MAG: ribosomal protein S16 [uncultured bacterium]|nr:MAG: ribosomal protein S16 [uncultured bacterium]HBR79062.1 30S ribosomal protein S16 [Candidatus Moranbacteria bacterium]
MIVIRFSRVGRKNKPQFRIVVQENSATPTGKHIEILGSWDPAQKKGVFKNERIQYWLGTGAQASDSVHNLLVAQKVIEAKKRIVKMKKVEEVKTEEAPAVATTSEAPVTEEVKAE